MDRPIFIDNVLGLETASLREILALVKRTYCGTFALQYMHISDPAQSAWLKERIEGYGKEITFTRAGPPGDPQQAGRGRGLREVPAGQVHRHQALRPRRRRGADPGDGADHQARRRARRRGDRHRHAAPRPALACSPTCMEKPYRAIFNEFQGGSFKPEEVEGSGDVKYHLGASSRPRVRRQQGAPVADRQPQPPRGGRPGGARQGPRQAGAAQRRRAHQGAADPAARRRRLRRPGRRRGMLRPLRASRATAPAARSTSSSTTRSASPPRRCTRAPRPIRPTSR